MLGALRSTPVTVRYANGPLLHMRGGAFMATLATFATEFRQGHVADGSRDGSRMLGSPAVVVGRATAATARCAASTAAAFIDSASASAAIDVGSSGGGFGGGGGGCNADGSLVKKDDVVAQDDVACGAACGGACGAACGAACGGVVILVSPHMEDGHDERSLTPFANAFRLASRGSFYQRWMDSTQPCWLPYRSAFYV